VIGAIWESERGNVLMSGSRISNVEQRRLIVYEFERCPREVGTWLQPQVDQWVLAAHRTANKVRTTILVHVVLD
jgi:hypothetical protein